MPTNLLTKLIITAICSYLIGNINFAILISTLLRGEDVRTKGSGNPGTMNMLRNFGGFWGLFTLILDALKGLVPALVAYNLFKGEVINGFEISDLALFVAGGCAVVGHIFPVFMKFKGGKGVSTTLGVFMASSPWLSLIIFLGGVAYIYICEYGSMGSIIFISALGIVQAVKFTSKYAPNGALSQEMSLLFFMLALVIFMLTITTYLAHRQNVIKLISGTEHKTRLKSIIDKSWSRLMGKLKKNKAN